MDPASAAGVALAVVGLSAQCFIGTLQAIQLILEAKNVKVDYAYLNTLLQLEQQRCYDWAKACGLLVYIGADGQVDAALESRLMRLNHDAILHTIIHVQSLVESFIKIRGKYENLVPDDKNEESPQIHSSAMQSANQSERLQDATSQRTLPELFDFLKRTRPRLPHSSLPKRIRWASFDKKRFETFVEQLRSLNNALLGLVDHEVQNEIRDITLETGLSVIQMSQRVDELSNLVKALLTPSGGMSLGLYDSSTEARFATKVAYRPSGLTSDLALQNNARLVDLARFKIQNASSVVTGAEQFVTRETQHDQLESLPESIELRPEHVIIGRVQLSDRLNTSDAVFCPPGAEPRKDVWVEWKYYNPSVRLRGPDPLAKERAEELAKLLKASRESTSFRIPTFLGFFDDAVGSIEGDGEESDLEKESAESDQHFRFGFVFQKPRISPQNTPARVFTLHELIKSLPPPSLTFRIDLSRKVAQTLRFLHSVDWLHKGFRSHNVIFFADDICNVDISDPSISGFDYARPARKGEQTERPMGPLELNYYRHPDTQGASEQDETQGFRKTFDIYSLGVVLVEIACWRTVDDLLKIEKPRIAATKKIKAKLLSDSSYLDAVEAGAGRLYRAAVQDCLTGGPAFGISDDDDETNVAISIRLLRAFSERVLRPLESINI